MKHYFKYESGYVNIDDENLYLTNSGNWQEARELEEKSPGTIKKNVRRIRRMRGFVYVVFGVFVLVFLETIDNNLLSFALIGLTGTGAYYVAEYFKSDLGVQYRIPLAKIEGIEQHGDTVKIAFRNAANEPDHETVRKIELKGLAILEELQYTNEAFKTKWV